MKTDPRQPHIRSLTTIITVFVAGILVFVSTAATALEPFDVTYQVYRNRLLIGHSQLSLTPDKEQTWRFRLVSEPVGWLGLFRREKADEISIVAETGKALRPLDYLKLHTRGKKIRKTHIVFDWDSGKVVLPDDDTLPTRSIPEHAQDKHSMQLAVIADLQRGKREDLVYTVVDDDRIKTYRFNNLGEEIVETPGGTFKSVKLERVRKKSDGKTLFWFAPELNYLPIKMEEIKDDGTRYRSVLENVSTQATREPRP